LETVARHSTPGLFAELVKALRPIVESTLPDRLRAEAALYLWQNYQPDLLLVHLVEYDKQAHETGPYSREALAALERSDQEIGRFRDAAGDRGETTLVVLSDHGFVPVENEAAPLVVLSEEGLFARRDSRWELKRLGAIHAGGSFALYWLEDPGAEDRRALDRALDRLSASQALAEVIDRSRLDSLGADPDAEMVLEAANGYYFSDRFEGPIACPSAKDRGTHGYLPTHRGMEAAFLVTGRGVAPRKNVGRVSLVQVGRTLTELLDLPRESMACEESPIDLG
jgi:predicted AlkP superfamily pyrophosphatase or phosphodiesterase